MAATIDGLGIGFVNQKLNNEPDNFPARLNCLHNSARFGLNMIG